jgi:type VI secretion system secreted protein Hcp
VSSDYFLEIDGIKGESQDDKHPGSIEVESFSWGASNPGNAAAGGGGGAGKVSFQDLHFASKTSKASPSLFLACASGMHFKKAVLTVRKAGERPVEYYKVTLSDLLVTGFNSAGDDRGEDSTPTDQFSLNFSRIEFAVNGLNSDGNADTGVTVSWDLKQNKG